MGPVVAVMPFWRGVRLGVFLLVMSSLGTLKSAAQTGLAGLQVSPSAIDFGLQNLNSQSAKQVTVRNAGSTSLTISGVTVSGAGFGFSNLAPGVSLAPGQQTLLQVSFKPLSSGTFSGKVTILSSGVSAAASVPLVGTGVNPATAAKTAQLAVATTTTVSNATIVSAPPPQAYLSWDASATPVVGYRVYRGTISGGPYTDATPTPVAALDYTDTSVAAGATYYYVVTSVNASGIESAHSNEVAAAIPGTPVATTPPPPPSPSPVPINPVTGVALNGSATLDGTRLRLTNSGSNLAGSAWFSNPVNVQTFSTDFTFQVTNTSSNPTGNGFTFVIQNTGTKAVGPSGGGLGYGPDKPSNASGSPNSPIGKSVAVKFDLVNNAGEGTNSTGLYAGGASPTIPAVTLGGGVNLHCSDIFDVHINYDGKTLTMTITDTITPSEAFTTSWPIDIPGTVGGNTAYVGFTGGTGSSVGNQDILTWNYNPSYVPAKAPVVYRTANLPAVSSGPTFRTFSYSAFPDSTGTILDATAVGNSVTFTVNVATAGTYDLKLSYKEYNTRGISQLTINGANVGAPLDQYLATEGYGTVDYGTFTFPQAGNYAFKFTVVGKDWNSGGYSVSFDDLTLTPQ